MPVNEFFHIILAQGTPTAMGALITYVWLTAKSDGTSTADKIDKAMKDRFDEPIKELTREVRALRTEVSQVSSRVTTLEAIDSVLRGRKK